jgi:hypothetical protein
MKSHSKNSLYKWAASPELSWTVTKHSKESAHFNILCLLEVTLYRLELTDARYEMEWADVQDFVDKYGKRVV